MQRLQRVHQHAGDVRARREHVQRLRAHFFQRVDVVDLRRLPRPGCTPSHQPWYAPQNSTRACGACGSCASRTACITASVPDMWNDTSSSPEML